MEMEGFRKKWRIFVIHHSHTDIGYTARQELICRQHADYLRQVVGILRRIDEGKAEDQRGFRWQCENFWQIENFWRHAEESDRADLIRYIREGRIGLSASYLNLTDLIDETVLREHLILAKTWAENIGVPLSSAMTADVNGYSAAWPDMLADAGVKYFYSALHTHHGMYPLYGNPNFFRWRGPDGKTVLTFVGEHYHWGHVLGLCPHGTSSFMLNDDFLREIECGRLFSSNAEATEQEELDLAVQRISRYLASLEEYNWPLDFVPVFVSGVISDNSPPNGRVAERVNRLNRLLKGQVVLEMSTLDAFFKLLEQSNVEIPEYSGDWTDWWADGIGSTPEAVKLYRDAQRSRNLASLLDPERKWIDPELWSFSGQNIMLYAEHTWGHSASVSDPYLSLVSSMSLKKTGYAVNANNAANTLLDGVLEGLGNRVITPDRSGNRRVLNPWPFPLTMPVSAVLLSWEYPEGRIQDESPLVLRDLRSNRLLPTQSGREARGRQAETIVSLNPGESMDLRIESVPSSRSMPPHTVSMCADAVMDQAGIPGLALPDYIETDSWILRTDPIRGISSLRDRKTGREWLDPSGPYGAFSCLYLQTPSAGPRTSSRRQMGRKRENGNTRHFTARPKHFAISDQGSVSVTLHVDYVLEGTDECILDLKLFRYLPRMNACIRIKKQSIADAEEIQIVLPFRSDGEDETWIDKTGCILRPGLDQLPGTCQAFWCLQNGILRRGKTFDWVIACPDAPLVSFGEDPKGPVVLSDGQSMEMNRAEIRSRIMNNFWETNFSVDLGGWHEFRYVISAEQPRDPKEQLLRCAALSTGLPVLEL